MTKINKYHSYNYGKLPKGCEYCVRGEKLVLFATGLCPRKCYFCPVSEDKYQKDVIYANEKKIITTSQLIEEAKLMNAKGAGITGGDPLAKVDRVVRYIKGLKKKFGPDFHVHMYTSLRLVSDERLQKLYSAGLDEIRFHPDLDSDQFWKRIFLASKFPWDVGIEVPLIPNKEKELKDLIDFIAGKVMFLNLNELEVADNNHSKLTEMGFKTKDYLSYAVQDSLELGLSLIEYVKEKEYPLHVHCCTAKLKDATQLTNRIKRESDGVKKPFDLVNDEGLLIRGALYLKELAPGVGYRNKLAEIDKLHFVAQLEPLMIKLKEKLKLSDDDLFLDRQKPRILLSKKVAKKNVAKILNLGLWPAIVKEYPTADQLEIEVEFLK